MPTYRLMSGDRLVEEIEVLSCGACGKVIAGKHTGEELDPAGLRWRLDIWKATRDFANGLLDKKHWRILTNAPER